MASTDLKLLSAGTLSPPGPIGRMARLGFAALCLWYVVELLSIAPWSLAPSVGIQAVIWNGVLPGLALVSYVINIGFSKAWGKRPAFVSLGFFLLAGVAGMAIEGHFATRILATTLWTWELYLFSHLGLAFLIAAVIGTPGCEMRAFHHLYSRMTGTPTKEHCCPVGPLTAIDRWESKP